MSKRNPVLYLSHGGGPLPLLGDPAHREMVDCLQTLAGRIARPGAILLVSAHWEADVPGITAAAAPQLRCDYYGFPEACYAIRYPAPGEPELAGEVQAALGAAGLEAQLDSGRGFDHGLFVPLKIMFPQADIPCVQLSLSGSLDAALHLRIGQALRALQRDDLVLIGSGFSFHNMRAFFSAPTAQTEAMNRAFEDWLRDTCCDPLLGQSQRQQRLGNWVQAPHARYCHPREEHLLPLHVCVGYAGDRAAEAFSLRILNRHASMFLWLD